MKKLYDYQKKAVKSTTTSDKGIVCMPTGVGKTFCQASMIANDIKKNSGFRIYILNAPRIMLSYQLLKEVYSWILECGITARYSFVHSGTKADETELEKVRTEINEKNDFDIPYSDIGATISVDGIIRKIRIAKEQNLPLIFFSTYNSAEKIEIARRLEKEEKIAMVLNDEAHYLVQERFYDILNTIKTDRCYFFTATMIHTPSDEGRGMNNVESYGEVLYEMLPIQAIKIGKMVRPRLHFVTTENIYNSEDYDLNLSKIIADTFEQHEKVLKKTEQTPKLLISTRGIQDIRDFIGVDEFHYSNSFTRLRNNGVNIYIVASSENIGCRINEETDLSRQVFLKRLKEDGEDKTKKLLVLHYDILAEGIDISGFTGIMPLRVLSKSKFLQTYGRSARPDQNDRKAIDEIIKAKGYMSNDDWSKMHKPYSYIIVSNILHASIDDKEYIVQLIKELRNYNFEPYEDIITSQITKGEIEIDEPDGDNEPDIHNKKIKVLIEGLHYRLEAERLAKLSDVDLANEILKET
jgi:superfamily II DNA or RNA helicase